MNSHNPSAANHGHYHTRHYNGMPVLSPPRPRQSTGKVDATLWGLALITVLFSILMVYSTSGVKSKAEFGTEWYYVKRQSVAAVLGFISLTILARLKPSFLRKVSPYCLIPAILVLVLPLIPGLGKTVNGATRWVSLGGLRFQPSEIAKVCFVIFLAGYFARHERRLEKFGYGMVRPLGLVGLLGVLLLSQPDFGTSAIIGLVALSMALTAGVSMSHLAVSGAVCLAAGTVLVIQSPYRLARVMTFLDPFQDATGKGYQLSQSLIAVGTGRLEGKGFGNSSAKLHFLPDAHTDFIFAVIAEELGFAGSVAVIALFLLFLWRGLRIARAYVNDTFMCTLALGLTLLLVFPAVINMGVVTGMLPTKGLPLPMVGYGGTSMVVSLSVVGLLLALSRGAHSPSK